MSKRPFQDTNFQRNAKKPRDDDIFFKKPIENNDFMSEDEDEEEFVLSQITDQIENCVVIQKRQNNVEISVHEIDGYSQFMVAGSSSTQISDFIPIQENPSSQKENNFIKPNNPIDLSTTQQTNNKELLKTINKLKDENQKYNGEVAYLRNTNKTLENELYEVKKRLNSEILNGSDQKVQKLENEIKKLRSQINFNRFNSEQRVSLNASTSNFKISEKQEKPTIKNLVTNIPANSNQVLKIPKNFFELIESDEHDRSNRASLNMNEIQMKIANYISIFTEIGEIPSSYVDEIQKDISSWIQQIENDILDKIIVSNQISISNKDFWNTKHFLISKTSLRPTIVNNEFSLTKGSKIFPEEICCPSRRVLGLIAIMCRQSPELSKKILQSQIIHRISEILNEKIIKSDRFSDYLGFIISASSLLAALSIHMDSRTDFSMMLLCFKRILFCQCDNPFIMLNCSEFLVEVLQHETAIPLISSSLCLNRKFPNSFSRDVKFCFVQEDVCLFGLFLMYLHTAFNVPIKASQTEIQVFQKVLINLNIISLKILEYGITYFKFLEQTTTNQLDNNCRCYRNLTHAILLLAQMSISRPSESKFS